ncbi:Dyp-type peroxidase [Nocardiopsis xinjiangensis]|uniref:Dyp-type peroxidase n=1 Tax=Nocardiopsis xinjiangensis TaxID=124285 RepID=UPI0003496453|nr:Dyp-type peroxidase [Nocardiopsis xinjiangensis]
MSAGPSRRGLFAGLGATGAAGLATGGLAGHAVAEGTRRGDPALAPARRRVETAEGRPPALAAPTPAHVHVLALDLNGANASEVRRAAREVLQAWEDHVPALHEAGLSELTEGSPTQGLHPASLGVTTGVGASLLERAGLTAHRTEEMEDLPSFEADDLDPDHCDGDLLLHVGAEDPVVVSSAVDHLVGLAGDHARVRWALPGFQRSTAAARDPSATPRNLMGHIDGTVNPDPGEALFDTQVRAVHTEPDPAWMDGGTYVVVRRIRMLLDTWFSREVDQREAVIGRRVSDGAPLSGDREEDLPDLAARHEDGTPVIPEHAHIRLASPEATLGARMARRSFSYDLGWEAGGRRRAGLLFTAWQADPRRGFTAVQQSLDEGGDALNDYVRHEGSALFAVPATAPGRPHPLLDHL